MSAGSNLLWYRGLSGRGIKPGLENVAELVGRLEDPQDSFMSIHVAGTDGKGSVCAMIESVLRASGYRTGLFTSPEIVRINECIRIDGSEIDDDSLEHILGMVREEADIMASEGRECTSFEVLTAAALLFFRVMEVDYAIIEVGMGGRLDSTNIITPVVTVINNVGLEHTSFLGATLEEVAFEKAGIMKPGVPCVTMNGDVVFDIIQSRARELGCELVRIGYDDPEVLSLKPDHVEFSYKGTVYAVGIPGRHQARNAALAIEALGFMADHQATIEPNLHEGLLTASLSCRMQKEVGLPMVIDVTHTVAGASMLASDISEIYGNVVLVLGMLADKDVDGVCRELAPICSRVVVTQPDSPRAMSAERVAEILSAYREVDDVCMDVQSAIDIAMASRGDDIVLVTGSFRMAEAALGWKETESLRYSTYCRRNMSVERIPDAIRRV